MGRSEVHLRAEVDRMEAFVICWEMKGMSLGDLSDVEGR